MAYQLLDLMTLVALLFTVPISLAGAAWVFSPVGSTKKSREAWNYRLSDVLLLVAQLALAGLLVFRPEPDFSTLQEIGGLAVLWVIITLWWAVGVRALSSGEIRDPLRRIVILGIVCPTVLSWPLVACACSILFMLIFGLIFVAIGLMFFSVVLWICRGIVRWAAVPPASAPVTRIRRGLTFAAILICGLLSTVVLSAALYPVYGGVTIGPIFYTTHLRRFRAEMRQRADIPAIQAWMKSTDLSTTKKLSHSRFEASELPECIRNFSHQVYSVDTGIRLTWGGGFGHWGLDVAPRGTTMPPSTPREYHLQLSDGAWVWHEIQ